MRGGTVARRYARALLGVAKEQGVVNEVLEGLRRVTAALEQPGLDALLASPVLDASARRDVVEPVIGALGIPPQVGNFVRLVVANRRLTELGGMVGAYESLVDRDLGRVRARVVSAVPVSGAGLERIVGAVAAVTGKQVLPTVEVDPEVLAGVVVQIEDTVFDGSLRTQLHRLRGTLVSSD